MLHVATCMLNVHRRDMVGCLRKQCWQCMHLPNTQLARGWCFSMLVTKFSFQVSSHASNGDMHQQNRVSLRCLDSMQINIPWTFHMLSASLSERYILIPTLCVDSECKQYFSIKHGPQFRGRTNQDTDKTQESWEEIWTVSVIDQHSTACKSTPIPSAWNQIWWIWIQPLTLGRCRRQCRPWWWRRDFRRHLNRVQLQRPLIK